MREDSLSKLERQCQEREQWTIIGNVRVGRLWDIKDFLCRFMGYLIHAETSWPFSVKMIEDESRKKGQVRVRMAECCYVRMVIRAPENQGGNE